MKRYYPNRFQYYVIQSFNGFDINIGGFTILNDALNFIKIQTHDQKLYIICHKDEL